MATTPLRPVNPLTISDWDRRLLQDFPSATIFHTAAWARVLANTYGYTPLYFRAGDPDKPTALLPLMEVDSWLTGRRGVSLPFTDECEPFCANAELFQALSDTVLTLGRERGWKYWESRGGQPTIPGARASTIFWGHRIDLQRDQAAIFDNLDDATRRAVRKAGKSDLTIEFSRELPAVRAFHELLIRTRRRHGVPVQPFAFFQNIQRHVLAPNHGQVILARHQGVPVAGAVFLHYGRTALYKFGASDERQQQLRANNRVMWEAIGHYAGGGYASLDFGRTSLGNEGLRRFKLGWGASERQIEYFRHDFRTGGAVSVPDGSSGWHHRVFRLLPAFLSRLIGALLYKHIA